MTYSIHLKSDPQTTNTTLDSPAGSSSHSLTGNSTINSPRPTKRRRIAPPRYHGLVLHDKRLRDILPQPAPALPTSASPLPPTLPVAPSRSTPPSRILVSSALHIPRPAYQVNSTCIDTAYNTFGIFRRYYTLEFPSHDPEREINLAMLSNIPTSSTRKDPLVTSKASDFYPYPNENSFLLGDWYWNHGNQKSQESFKRLLNIVGSANFSPRDICDTNWSQINRMLAVNDWDEGEWVDEDAGWQKSTITISVPFHRFLNHPGVRDYVVPNFYHQPLMSVIQERLKRDAVTNRHFHFEPFELLWKPNIDLNTNDLGLQVEPDIVDDTPIRLYGELYTSPAFLAAHQDLQNMTGEPNCNLQRVVIGLMFWSDATHLATYGHANLWPLYMAFGNDSKYQRCQPSANLFEHVAYFEKVR